VLEEWRKRSRCRRRKSCWRRCGPQVEIEIMNEKEEVLEEEVERGGCG